MSLEIGKIYDVTVTGITNFGAFVSLLSGEKGMVHISQISQNYVKDITLHLAVGQNVKAKLISIDEYSRLGFSIKQTELPKTDNNTAPPKPQRTAFAGKEKPTGSDFEDMMNTFKKQSEEKLRDYNKIKNKKSGYGKVGGKNGKSDNYK